MRDFTRTLLAWLYQYPFPHGVTQKALSAFLGEEPMQKTTGSEPWVVKDASCSRLVYTKRMAQVTAHHDLPCIGYMKLELIYDECNSLEMTLHHFARESA